jgi:hypothetical protein
VLPNIAIRKTSTIPLFRFKLHIAPSGIHKNTPVKAYTNLVETVNLYYFFHNRTYSPVLQKHLSHPVLDPVLQTNSQKVGEAVGELLGLAVVGNLVGLLVGERDGLKVGGVGAGVAHLPLS